MDLSNFWLKSSNGKLYKLEDLKDLSLTDVANNPKLKKLIKLFDADGNIQTKNIKGENEWQSIFTELQKAANGDNILTNDEFDKFISKKMPDSGITQNDLNDLLDAASTKETKNEDGRIFTYLNGKLTHISLFNESGSFETRLYSKINTDGFEYYKVKVFDGEKYTTYYVADFDKKGDFKAEDVIQKDVSQRGAKISFRYTYYSGKLIEREELEKINNIDEVINKSTYKHTNSNVVITSKIEDAEQQITASSVDADGNPEVIQEKRVRKNDGGGTVFVYTPAETKIIKVHKMNADFSYNQSDILSETTVPTSTDDETVNGEEQNRSLQSVLEYMTHAGKGELSYNTEDIKNLFDSLGKEGSEYEKVSDNPPVFAKKYVEEVKKENKKPENTKTEEPDKTELKESTSQTITISENPLSLEYGTALRTTSGDREYIISFAEKGMKANKRYHFSSDGTFKYMEYKDTTKPDMEQIVYPNGERTVIGLKDGRQSSIVHYDKDDKQIYTKAYEWDENGRIKYTVTQYSENAPEDVRNTQVIAQADGNMFYYTKDKDGKFTILKQMRTCESVPILNDNNEIIGYHPVTTMNVMTDKTDKNGKLASVERVKGAETYSRTSLKKQLQDGERFDFSAVDNELRSSAANNLIHTIDNALEILESEEAEKGWLDVSTWLQHALNHSPSEKLKNFFGEGRPAAIKRLKEMRAKVQKMLECSYVTEVVELKDKKGSPVLDKDGNKIYEKYLYRANQYDSNLLPDELHKLRLKDKDGKVIKNADIDKFLTDSYKKDEESFAYLYNELTGKLWEDSEKDKYQKFSQVIQRTNQELKYVYETYKKQGSLPENTKGLFAKYCGENEFNSVLFNEFIKQADELKDKNGNVNFLATEVGGRKYAELSSNLVKDSKAKHQLNKIIAHDENIEDYAAMATDLIGMSLEFLAIAKVINYAGKALKGTVALTKSKRLKRIFDATKAYMESESKIAKALVYAKMSANGAANFAVYEGLSEWGRQDYQGQEIDAGKIGHKMYTGALTGGSAPLLSSGWRYILNKFKPYQLGREDFLRLAEEQYLKKGKKGLSGDDIKNIINPLKSAPTLSSAPGAKFWREFVPEVITFGIASSSVQIFDGVEVRENIKKARENNPLLAKLTDEEIENMSKTDLMRAMLKMQGKDTDGKTDAEVYAMYGYNEFWNQFEGLGKLKIAESIVGMFISRGKMPSGPSGKRTKALDFLPKKNEQTGEISWYEKSNPDKPLTAAEMTMITEQAMAYDAFEARVQNRFNKYKDKPMSGKEFTNYLNGKEGSEPDPMGINDGLTIIVKDGKYEVTTEKGVKTVTDLEGVLDIYNREYKEHQDEILNAMADEYNVPDSERKEFIEVMRYHYGLFAANSANRSKPEFGLNAKGSGKVLEGGIRDTELTEVAPFVKTSDRVQDLMTIGIVRRADTPILFDDVVNRLKERNFEDIEMLKNMSIEDRHRFMDCLTDGTYDIPTFLAFANGDKPAMLGLSHLETAKKIKYDGVDVVARIEEDGTGNYFLLNREQVKSIINDNFELFQKRMNMPENSTVDDIYAKLISEESPLTQEFGNQDIIGLVLGFPKYSCMLFTDCDYTNMPIEEIKAKMKEDLYNGSSIYSDMSDEFKKDYENAIDNLLENKKGTDVLSGRYVGISYMFGYFSNEPKEIERIQASIDHTDATLAAMMDPYSDAKISLEQHKDKEFPNKLNKENSTEVNTQTNPNNPTENIESQEIIQLDIKKIHMNLAAQGKYYDLYTDNDGKNTVMIVPVAGKRPSPNAGVPFTYTVYSFDNDGNIQEGFPLEGLTEKAAKKFKLKNHQAVDNRKTINSNSSYLYITIPLPSKIRTLFGIEKSASRKVTHDAEPTTASEPSSERRIAETDNSAVSFEQRKADVIQKLKETGRLTDGISDLLNNSEYKELYAEVLEKILAFNSYPQNNNCFDHIMYQLSKSKNQKDCLELLNKIFTFNDSNGSDYRRVAELIFYSGDAHYKDKYYTLINDMFKDETSIKFMNNVLDLKLYRSSEFSMSRVADVLRQHYMNGRTPLHGSTYPEYTRLTEINSAIEAIQSREYLRNNENFMSAIDKILHRVERGSYDTVISWIEKLDSDVRYSQNKILIETVPDFINDGIKNSVLDKLPDVVLSNSNLLASKTFRKYMVHCGKLYDANNKLAVELLNTIINDKRLYDNNSFMNKLVKSLDKGLEEVKKQLDDAQKILDLNIESINENIEKWIPLTEDKKAVLDLYLSDSKYYENKVITEKLGGIENVKQFKRFSTFLKTKFNDAEPPKHPVIEKLRALEVYVPKEISENNPEQAEATKKAKSRILDQLEQVIALVEDDVVLNHINTELDKLAQKENLTNKDLFDISQLMFVADVVNEYNGYYNSYRKHVMGVGIEIQDNKVAKHVENGTGNSLSKISSNSRMSDEYNTVKRSSYAATQKQLKEREIENTARFDKDVLAYQAVAEENQFGSMREYIQNYPETKLAEHFYNEYYLKHLEKDGIDISVIQKCKEFADKYNLRLMVPTNCDTEVLQEVCKRTEKIIKLFYDASNGTCKFPPLLDYNSVGNWEGAAGYTTHNAVYVNAKGRTTFDFNSVERILRHEFTHYVDKLLQGEKISDDVDIDNVMPRIKDKDGKTIAIDYANCKYMNILIEAGISKEHAKYAYENALEFKAVAMEGNVQVYNKPEHAEFKQFLLDIGTPEWMFDIGKSRESNNSETSPTNNGLGFNVKPKQQRTATSVDHKYPAKETVTSDEHIENSSKTSIPELTDEARKARIDKLNALTIESPVGKNLDKKIFEFLTAVKEEKELDSGAVAQVRQSIKVLKNTKPDEAKVLEMVLDAVVKNKTCAEISDEEFAAIANHLIRQYDAENKDIQSRILADSTGAKEIGAFNSRVKSDTSLFDKIYNYAKKNPNKPFIKAISDVRDCWAGRFVMEDLKPQTVDGNPQETARKTLDSVNGKLKDFIYKLIGGEIEGMQVYRVSNYTDKDKVGIISANDIWSMEEAAIGQDLLVERNKTVATKMQDSGYPAFQVNIRLKNGKIIELQFRFESVDSYAEAEHLIYDLLTGKDIIGRNSHLSTVYDPFKKILKKNLSTDEAKAKYQEYTRAEYQYRFYKALGIEIEKPKLEDYTVNGKKFDEILSADNLIKIHEIADKLKHKEISKEEGAKRFNALMNTETRGANAPPEAAAENNNEPYTSTLFQSGRSGESVPEKKSERNYAANGTEIDINNWNKNNKYGFTAEELNILSQVMKTPEDYELADSVISKLNNPLRENLRHSDLLNQVMVFRSILQKFPNIDSKLIVDLLNNPEIQITHSSNFNTELDLMNCYLKDILELASKYPKYQTEILKFLSKDSIMMDDAKAALENPKFEKIADIVGVPKTLRNLKDGMGAIHFQDYQDLNKVLYGEENPQIKTLKEEFRLRTGKKLFIDNDIPYEKAKEYSDAIAEVVERFKAAGQDIPQEIYVTKLLGEQTSGLYWQLYPNAISVMPMSDIEYFRHTLFHEGVHSKDPFCNHGSQKGHFALGYVFEKDSDNFSCDTQRGKKLTEYAQKYISRYGAYNINEFKAEFGAMILEGKITIDNVEIADGVKKAKISVKEPFINAEGKEIELTENDKQQIQELANYYLEVEGPEFNNSEQNKANVSSDAVETKAIRLAQENDPQRFGSINKEKLREYIKLYDRALDVDFTTGEVTYIDDNGSKKSLGKMTKDVFAAILKSQIQDSMSPEDRTVAESMIDKMVESGMDMKVVFEGVNSGYIYEGHDSYDFAWIINFVHKASSKEDFQKNVNLVTDILIKMNGNKNALEGVLYLLYASVDNYQHKDLGGIDLTNLFSKRDYVTKYIKPEQVMRFFKAVNDNNISPEVIDKILYTKGLSNYDNFSEENWNLLINIMPVLANFKPDFIEKIDIHKLIIQSRAIGGFNNYTFAARQHVLDVLKMIPDNIKNGFKQKGLDLPLLQKNLEGSLTTVGFDVKTDKTSQKRFFKTFITSNSASELAIRSRAMTEFLDAHENTGLPLKYSRENFVKDLNNLINKLPREEREAVFNHLNISLTDKSFTGFLKLDDFDLSKFDKSSQNTILAVQKCVKDFAKNNEVECDNPKIKEVLDDLIQGFPEFASIMGRIDADHNNKLEVHILKVLNAAINNPNYQRLTNEEQKTLKFAILMHDFAKLEGEGGEHGIIGAVYARSILDKFNLNQTMRENIVNLIKYHHFSEGKFEHDFKDYFRTPSEQKVASIIAQSDYEARFGRKLNVDNYVSKGLWETETFRKSGNKLGVDQNSSASIVYPKHQYKLPDGRIVSVPVVDMRGLTGEEPASKYGWYNKKQIKDVIVQAHNCRSIEAIKTVLEASVDPTFEIDLSTHVHRFIDLDGNNDKNANRNYGQYVLILSTKGGNVGQISTSAGTGGKKGLNDYLQLLKYGSKDMTAEELAELEFNEVQALSPKVEQIVVLDNISPKELPLELVKLAYKYNVPIVIMKQN